MDWTKEQLQAIEYDQAMPLLISAAAGSGKTAVLIERIFRRTMTDKIQPENILVMTFTEKAALQMRQKIDRKISDALQTTSDPEQQEKLRSLKRRFPLAKISTIHAFCLNLIRDYAAFLTDETGELLLSPGFSILSAAHSAIYLEQAMDDVLDFIYQKAAESELNDPLTESQSIAENIPDRRAETALFNILEENISEKEWLEDFENLSFVITESLDDQALREHLAKSWKQLRSIAYFARVIQKALRNYQTIAADFSQSMVLQENLDQLKEQLPQALIALQEAEQTAFFLTAASGKIKSKEAAKLPGQMASEKQVLQNIAAIFEQDLSGKEQWNLIYEQTKHLDEIISLRTPAANHKNAEQKLEFMALYEQNVLPVIALLNKNFKASSTVAQRNFLQHLCPVFAKHTSEIEHDLQKMIGPLARYFEIVLLIENRMQQIKAAHNCVDFNDLEHYALQLLDQKTIAEAVQKQYREIYVDEYQDTNPIQETIIRRINCPRTFMVGDLKQSIYRFRHADPGLFREKLAAFSPYEDFSEKNKLSPNKLSQEQSGNVRNGYTILLNQNFRSAETILQGINELFAWFMQEAIAEITYDEKQALKPGKTELNEEHVGKKKIQLEYFIHSQELFHKSLEMFQELSSVEMMSSTDQALLMEALQAVKIIKEQIAQGRKYEEFAILGRSHRICSVYAAVLQAFHIPNSGNQTKVYLDSTELRFLIRLIEVLDNQKQDIPLAAVMRSPLFGFSFSEDELLFCSLLIPELNFFYEKIAYIANSERIEILKKAQAVFGSDLAEEFTLPIWQKVQKFTAQLAELREKALWLSLSDLLDDIFAIADYPGYLAALPYADQRLEDIEKFKQWAEQFSREQGGGLHEFMLFLRKIMEQKIELENFDTPPAVEHSVSIMTIHASKGLEFPMVFLAGAGNELFTRNVYPLISFEPRLGLASYTADAAEQIIYTNPNLLWQQQQILHQEWAEEYRLLYVAMTRAEEQFIVLANRDGEKKENQDFQKLYALLKEKLTIANMQNLKSYFEIIIAYLAMKNSDVLSLYTEEYALTEDKIIDFENYKMTVHPGEKFLQKLKEIEIKEQEEYLAAANNTEENHLPEQIALTGSKNQKIVERLKNLIQDFPVQDIASRLPAKLTVSELSKARQNVTEEAELAVFPGGMADMSFTLRIPQIEQTTQKAELSGAEFGTLVHDLLHFLDFKKFYQLPQERWQGVFDKQIEQMISQHKISSAHQKQIAYAYPFIAQFIASDLGSRLIRAELTGAPIYREIPFTLAVPPQDFLAEGNERSIKVEILNQINEPTIVQGMIDLWFMENEQAVLIDYKTDYIPGDERTIAAILQERYQVQLDYYALAIEKIIGLAHPVTERYIWLLREGKAYLL